jgi:hypothetical protein
MDTYISKESFPEKYQDMLDSGIQTYQGTIRLLKTAVIRDDKDMLDYIEDNTDEDMYDLVTGLLDHILYDVESRDINSYPLSMILSNNTDVSKRLDKHVEQYMAVNGIDSSNDLITSPRVAAAIDEKYAQVYDISDFLPKYFHKSFPTNRVIASIECILIMSKESGQVPDIIQEFIAPLLQNDDDDVEDYLRRVLNKLLYQS